MKVQAANGAEVGSVCPAAGSDTAGLQSVKEARVEVSLFTDTGCYNEGRCFGGMENEPKNKAKSTQAGSHKWRVEIRIALERGCWTLLDAASSIYWFGVLREGLPVLLFPHLFPSSDC